VTRNGSLQRTLRRTLQACDATVEFVKDLREASAGAALILIDRECRQESDPRHIQLIAQGGKMIVLGDSIADDDVVALLRNLPMNHVISESQEPDESELVVTSFKLLTGDIFGLEKYLSWGVMLREIRVYNYDEKRAALDAIGEYARAVGVRRQVIAKIESVTDELLMNALYDAPAVRNGSDKERLLNRASRASFLSDQPALLRFACDGRHFGISVQDNYGELRKEAILDHLSRARAEGGRPKINKSPTGGAGLGLYFILSSVSRFIANIDPGHRTEVICLFNVKDRSRDSCAQSLHIFRLDDKRAVDAG
jgi:hypothetical protein